MEKEAMWLARKKDEDRLRRMPGAGANSEGIQQIDSIEWYQIVTSINV